MCFRCSTNAFPQRHRNICGSWVRDEACRHGGDNVIFESIGRPERILPFFQQHIEVLDYAETLTPAAIIDPLTPVCKITALPTEILQQILHHIIPTGCIFQFFPGRIKGEPIECVQKFVREPHTRGFATGSTDLAIARTCRRLQDEAYMLFYGENTFTFHLSICAVRPETRVLGDWNI